MGLNLRRKFSDNDTVKAALEPCGVPVRRLNADIE